MASSNVDSLANRSRLVAPHSKKGIKLIIKTLSTDTHTHTHTKKRTVTVMDYLIICQFSEINYIHNQASLENLQNTQRTVNSAGQKPKILVQKYTQPLTVLMFHKL